MDFLFWIMMSPQLLPGRAAQQQLKANPSPGAVWGLVLQDL